MISTMESLSGQKNNPPIWSLDYKDPNILLTWLNTEFERRFELSQGRLIRYAENVCLYKGIHYRAQDVRNNEHRDQDVDRPKKNPKIVINHIYDMIHTKLGKLTRYRPNIAAIPATSEYEDKINARIVEKLVQSKWYELNIDRILRQWQEIAFIYGEGFCDTVWDPYIGPKPKLHGILQKLKGKTNPEEQPTLNVEKSVTIDNEDGQAVSIKPQLKLGDIAYRLITPDKIYPQIRTQWDKVENYFEIEFRPLEELKVDYHQVQDKIVHSNAMSSAPAELFGLNFKNLVLVKHFYHRPTRYLPNGLYVVSTNDVILKAVDWPYESKEGEKIEGFSITRLSDIDVPEELHGRSFIDLIRQPSQVINNVISTVVKSYALCAHPKWLKPNGSGASVNTLGNDTTVVSYNWPQKPELATYSPIPPQSFDLAKEQERYIEKLSGVSPVSRGEPPAGIKSGVALQFLDEQEAERSTPEVSKRNHAIVELAQRTIERMGQYYKSDDGRMIKMIGKENEFELQKFDDGVFDRPYDVKIQNASALPQSKALRIQTIIDLQSAFPGLIRPEQIVDLLDLGQEQKFKDLITVAVRAAEAENEGMISGKEVMEPQQWEEHIVHYQIHLKQLQELSFKEEIPSEGRVALIEHITTTEFLMWQKAQTNSVFAGKLQQLDMFPVFFKVPNIQSVSGNPASTTGAAHGGANPVQLPEAAALMGPEPVQV